MKNFSRGDLIPNNRVITDSNYKNDFSLVEGITYNIVHLKSGLNLDIDGNKARVSFESSPYQYWTLRKANNSHYNIINVNLGRNLDSDGQNTYISDPRYNSIYNLYQRWLFKKIEDDLFNIVHVKSRNLDSNGLDVYISDNDNDSKTNPFQQWLFEPSNYNLTAVVTDFEYPPDLKDKLNQYKTRTSLSNYTIENNANVTIKQWIDKTEFKMNTYFLEIRKSDSLAVTKNIGMSYNIGATIFGILGINTGFSGGIRREFHSTHEKVYRESITEMVSYNIRQRIIVPPFNSVIVNSTIDKVIINVPFKAKIRITGKADRLNKSGKVISMTDVEVNAIRCYLQKEDFNVKNITVEGNTLIVDTNGTMNINGYGLETKIETIEIPHKHPKDEPPEPSESPEPELPAPEENKLFYNV
ncbi:fungal-specific transcription factor domain-containing protein [Rhizophagus clarus]|uniref:Fungal-specific transcription factor domain-containing protein n=1 Tax=Rhizophagus clarus TaxID=94130 RepID=A0A8H3M2P7_9GLOM|nr:fungal-specific transcription factor domain-containing protein [Rhizophagus clarus]